MFFSPRAIAAVFELVGLGVGSTAPIRVLLFGCSLIIDVGGTFMVTVFFSSRAIMKIGLKLAKIEDFATSSEVWGRSRPFSNSSFLQF
jgi:hypothetical protein